MHLLECSAWLCSDDSLDLTYLKEYLEEQHALLVAVSLERAAAPRRGGEQRVRAPPVAARVARCHAGRCHAAPEIFTIVFVTAARSICNDAVSVMEPSEVGSGMEPGSEGKEMSEAELVVLIFFLLVLVCLAAYVLWRLHRKRNGGLGGRA